MSRMLYLGEKNMFIGISINMLHFLSEKEWNKVSMSLYYSHLLDFLFSLFFDHCDIFIPGQQVEPKPNSYMF